MSDTELKVVIVDDDEQRINLIKSYLPAYMEACAVGFSDAIEAMLPIGDKKTDLVIMHADDRKGRSLQLFEKMNTEYRESKLFMIPVLLITRDEFSDKAMEFMEIGDAIFYECEKIDENDLYHVVMEAIEKGAIAVEEDFEAFPPVYDPVPVSVDRIMNKTFSVATEKDAPQRSAVIKGEERIKEILKAVSVTKEQAVFVKQIIEEAMEEDNDSYSYQYSSGSKGSGIIPSSSRSESEAKESGIIWTKPESKIIESYELGRNRIVIIDDDSRTEKACRLFLNQDYEIVLLNSGNAAVDFFSKNNADVILVEYELPDMNGATALSKVRLQPNGAYVPAVMMFKKDTPSNIISSIKFGGKVIATVSKPITKKELSVAVNTCIKMRHR